MQEAVKNDLIGLFNAGVTAVAGFEATQIALKNIDFQPDLIIGVGKAASGMCKGALSVHTSCPVLLVTKYLHADSQLSALDQVTAIESAHPIPDENSLLAGQTILAAVETLASTSCLFLLVSGCASALAEHLSLGIDLVQWQQMTTQMLAQGHTIEQINTKRKQHSLIKDGKLLKAFKGKRVEVLAISDVEGDDISVIGSGLGDTKHCIDNARYQLIATNETARSAVVTYAEFLGYEVQHNKESLYKDIEQLAPEIAKVLQSAQAGVYIWGGEPTVILPKEPGNGGRNQSLALLLAQEIKGLDHINLLIAGTDGTDGPTDAAGGIVDGNTVTDINVAQDYLQRADAGSYLRERGDIFITGPTSTNVMDLVIAVIKK